MDWFIDWLEITCLITTFYRLCWLIDWLNKCSIDWLILIKVAEKVKEFFHHEGIHSTTIQPEFVETELNSSTLASSDDCVLSCPKVNKYSCVQFRAMEFRLETLLYTPYKRYNGRPVNFSDCLRTNVLSIWYEFSVRYLNGQTIVPQSTSSGRTLFILSVEKNGLRQWSAERNFFWFVGD